MTKVIESTKLESTWLTNNSIDTRVKFHQTESDLYIRVHGSLKKQCIGDSSKEDCELISYSRNLGFESSEEDISHNISNHSPVVIRKRKRRRLSSSDKGSPENSRSLSPELSYDSPASYKLVQLENKPLIIKIPMNRGTRRSKCSDLEISHMVNEDSDSEIFENYQKMGAQVVGSLSQGSRSSETPERDPKKRMTRSRSRDSISEHNTPKREQGAIKMRLRRSTEQSNYKIQSILEEDDIIVRTPRSTKGTPKKCGNGDCDEYHGIVTKTRGTPKTRRKTEVSVKEARTPITRRTRTTPAKMKDIHENSHENDNLSNDDSETDLKKTPKKRLKHLDESRTPLATRRASRLNSISVGTPLKSTLDKENKSENDADEDSDNTIGHKRQERNTRRSLMETPRKHVKISEEVSTPRRTLRKAAEVNYEESTPTTKTPQRSMKHVDEPVTPKSSKKTVKISTPLMKSVNLTPSMSRRTANIAKPKTAFDETRGRLHVSAVPKSLPCREAEFNDIYQFLERKLLDKSGGCIYISGVPGTGKTATVNEVVRCLKKLVAKDELEHFDFIQINGLNLSEPRQAYVQILKQINGESLTWEQAYRTLDKHFTQSKKKRPMTLLLVDELDILCNKRQDVIYNLLDWPSKANARLVVITIANTMDLPERVLMGRVTSRLGLTRLTFQPYNHKQLQEIILARLRDNGAFKSEAVQLVARKVAAVSGDARRALDICRRATEIAELGNGEIVTMQDINEALTEMISSVKVRAIKHCSEMEKMFLHAVSAEVRRTGVEETNFRSVYIQLNSLCSFEGVKTPNVTEALGICAKLGANRLLLSEHSRMDVEQRILLNVSIDDINFALENTNVS